MAKLYFYYSAMNAGKSTTLLQASHNYEERGMQTLIFSPKIDTRFDKPVVYSRLGIQQDAIPFDNDFSFFKYVKEQNSQLNNLKCILVDEAHFLNKSQVLELSDIATQLNIAVLTYGLRSDFLAEPFEGSKYLLVYSEEIIEIKTMCKCGKKATMNLRIDENGEPIIAGDQVQIGGNESYISLCMKCFKKKVPLNAANPILTDNVIGV